MSGTTLVLAEFSRAWDHYDMMGDGMSPGWAILMTLVMAAFLAAVILLIVWVVRGQPGGGNESDAARATLRQRLASGSISPEEFERLSEMLDRD